MQMFNCKVRLAGNVGMEVRKTGVTAAEVEVLRALHGHDAVLDLDYVGDLKPSEDISNVKAHVMDGLTRTYGASSVGDTVKTPVLEAAFGRSMRLPTTLEDFEIPVKKRGKAKDDNPFS